MSSRESFLQSLFEFDVEELVEWHRFRASPEKRRFLRFVDSFYRWHKKQVFLPVVPEDVEISPPLVHDTPGDPGVIAPSESGESTTQASSIGDSSLGVWVARRGRRPRSTAATSCGWTNVSEMAPTENSVCSAPLPMSRLQFRSHRRGIAVNRRLWRAPDAHVPSSTIPTDQFPDNRRLISMQMRAFGRPAAKGAAVDERTLRGIFKVEKFPIILAFLASETTSNKEAHVGVFRALHALRRTSHYETTAGKAYDLNEDFRLWKPKRATPALTPYQIFASKIPIGTLAATINEILAEAEEAARVPGVPEPRRIPEVAAPKVEEDTLSELTASDATHVTLEYFFCCVRKIFAGFFFGVFVVVVNVCHIMRSTSFCVESTVVFCIVG